MKKFLFIVTLLIGIAASSNAQVIYPSSDTKKDVTLKFEQWSSYSDYAGYYVSVQNNNSEPVTVIVTANDAATGISLSDIYTLNPGEYQLHVLGYYGPWIPPAPYVEGLHFQGNVTGAVSTQLNVKTIGSPYTTMKKVSPKVP